MYIKYETCYNFRNPVLIGKWYRNGENFEDFYISSNVMQSTEDSVAITMQGSQ